MKRQVAQRCAGHRKLRACQQVRTRRRSGTRRGDRSAVGGAGAQTWVDLRQHDVKIVPHSASSQWIIEGKIEDGQIRFRHGKQYLLRRPVCNVRVTGTVR
ncbi:hypothetical protein ACFOGJ_18880 [Marinibaculum pumilum]|uniref:Uncharacterized protein n=1 Tax=Marinibaculum pumilum TaxID=1766165 RepID=A0ABV7L448_9PROT